jgi:hypothetical protein
VGEKYLVRLIFLSVFVLLVLPFVSAIIEQEWYSLSDVVENSTTSTGFVQKARLNWLPSEVADWLVLVSYEMQGENSGTAVEVRVQLDDSELIGEASREQTGNEYWAVSHMKLLQNLSIAQHIVDLDWRSGSTGGTSRIRNVRIQAMRLDDELNAEIFYNESESNSTTTSSYADKAVLNITPRASGLYVLLGNVELDGNAVNNTALARIRANSNTIPLALGSGTPRANKHFSAQGQDVSDRFSFNYFGLLNLSAVQNNISVQVAHEGTTPFTAFRGRALLWRIDDVYEYSFVVNETEVNTTSNTTLTNFSVLDFTPTVSLPYLILQAAGYATDADGKAVHATFLKDTNQTSNATFTSGNASDYFVSTSYSIENLTATPQRIANAFRALGQPTAFAKVSSIVVIPTQRGRKLVIEHFNLSEASGGRHVFDMLIKNNISQPIPFVNWTISAGALRVSATKLENLSVNQTMHVIFEHNFTNSGDILVRARVTNGSIGDRKFVLVSIGDEIDVLNLSNVTAGLRQVFRFLVSSLWNTNRVVDWKLNTTQIVINTSASQVLEPFRNMTVIVEYNYTAGGTFKINASANTTITKASENITITI